MLSHAEFKKKALSQPEVKAAYDALADEYFLARELFAREADGLTQAEVTSRMHTLAVRLISTKGL
ncbi:MAG: hypothetical protein NTY00_10050 [Deltaproteobacteria bacterium]|nr:hypothetical protein [Deltaproteobacteria bacterium]